MREWQEQNAWAAAALGPLQGYFHVIHRGPDGKIKREFDTPNLILTTGKIMLAGILTGESTPFARNLGIGTGTTTPVIGDTTLENEVGTRVSALFAQTSTTAYYTGIFTADNPATQQTINEYGLFSLAAAGYMFVHTTAPAIVKATADSLEVQYRIAVQ